MARKSLKKRSVKNGVTPETSDNRKRQRLMNNSEEAKQRKSNGKDICKKRRKWFRKNKHEQSVPKDTKPQVKTVSHYLKTNPSSNWKNLMEVLKFDEKKTGIPINSLKPKQRHQKIESKTKVTSTADTKNSLTPNNNDSSSQKFGIWFDGVDEELLKLNEIHTTTVQSTQHKNSDNALSKPGTFSGCTKTVAIDCEMVGVGDGGKENELARVSIVNRMGHTVYDKFVRPREEVVDYRTHVSGVRPSDLENAEEFSMVQKEVYDIIKSRILVGHAIHNDLKVLYLSHPKSKIRDTSKYKPFRKLFNGRNPSLKKLSEKLLGVAVQTGEHNSVQDAQAAMRLYTMHRNVWEKELKFKNKKKTTLEENT